MRFGELSHASYIRGSLRAFNETMGILSYYSVGGNFPIGSSDTKMFKETSRLLACVSSSLGGFLCLSAAPYVVATAAIFHCPQIPGSSPNIK